MSASGFVIALTLIVALVAIGYVWRRVAGEPGLTGDGTPGSIMDGHEQVRRIDLGTHVFVAQQALDELENEGVDCRVVELESGAFGMGLGNHHYLVYSAEDEPRVKAVVDRLLAELD